MPPVEAQGINAERAAAGEAGTLHSIQFSHAFQPILEGASGGIVSYESLLRGVAGEPAGSVFDQVPADLMVLFDQHSREQGLRLAGKLKPCCLNLNFTPNSLLYRGGYFLQKTLDVARDLGGFKPQQLVVEITESEVIEDVAELVEITNSYRAQGVTFSIDDFGAGYAGLNLLAELQPEQLKLDMILIRGIHEAGPRQSIVKAVLEVCLDLGIVVLAEGVETEDEFFYLLDAGVELFQGFLFARPGFESLPGVCLPERR